MDNGINNQVCIGTSAMHRNRQLAARQQAIEVFPTVMSPRKIAFNDVISRISSSREAMMGGD
jgi:hypothetical protein